jgi:hypothetical protein
MGNMAIELAVVSENLCTPSSNQHDLTRSFLACLCLNVAERGKEAMRRARDQRHSKLLGRQRWF